MGEAFMTSDDPKDNGRKVRALLRQEGGQGWADLYRTIHAGPSGQRARLKVGRVRWVTDMSRPDDFQIIAGDASTAGWARYDAHTGEWVIHEEAHDGRLALAGRAATLSVGVDVLLNGAHAATGRHDSQRVGASRCDWRPYHQELDRYVEQLPDGEPRDPGNVPVYAARIVEMIRDDVTEGQIPRSVGNFAELHEHVDANDYLQHAGQVYDATLASNEEIAAVQDEVTRRIRDGALLSDDGQPMPGRDAEPVDLETAAAEQGDGRPNR